jgi:hypothetical protein
MSRAGCVDWPDDEPLTLQLHSFGRRVCSMGKKTPAKSRTTAKKPSRRTAKR